MKQKKVCVFIYLFLYIYLYLYLLYIYISKTRPRATNIFIFLLKVNNVSCKHDSSRIDAVFMLNLAQIQRVPAAARSGIAANFYVAHPQAVKKRPLH